MSSGFGYVFKCPYCKSEETQWADDCIICYSCRKWFMPEDCIDEAKEAQADLKRKNEDNETKQEGGFSAYSLEHKLTDKQFERMRELKKEVFGGD